MHVIGTAGHVDHGKSTLVAALTGIHPDRLKEEQAREMTIDLGFAWMELPGVGEIGIVDVPGHRDFIDNMLAGVGGIDAVMFVVAADEGVMPQTREHLAILDILQVQGGVIVLSKVDMVDEPEWLDMVEMDVMKLVNGTVLGNVPVVRVSARTGFGLEQLKQVLVDCLTEHPARVNSGRARLPVDRIFTMPGFGTVVTGTLLDGNLHVGQEIEFLPHSVKGRVRGLQSHKKKEEIAVPGSRTAVNISGVEIGQVQRGDVLAPVGCYQATQRMDVHFHLLPDASAPLRHSSEVKLYVGTTEVIARVRLLGIEELTPGQDGYLQLELYQQIVAVRGDRYILRRPSPGETLGGGVVIDPLPKGRHKRFNDGLIDGLEALRHGSPSDVLLQSGLALGTATLGEVVKHSHLGEEQAKDAIRELAENGQIVLLEPGIATIDGELLVAPQSILTLFSDKAVVIVQNFHMKNPLKRGIPREELKSRLKLTSRVFNAYLYTWVNNGIFVEKGTLVSAPDHQVQYNPAQRAAVGRLMSRFASAPYAPPSIKECIVEVGEDVYSDLVDVGELKIINAEVVFRPKDYETMLAAVYAHFAQQPTLTAAQFRDQFQTSRRYALAFLENLDAQGVTARNGDVRVLRKNPIKTESN